MPHCKWVVVALAAAAALLGQTQTSDTYTFAPPAGYALRAHDQSVEMTKIDQKNRTFCQLGLYRAQTALGTAAQDIDAEWKAVVEKQFRVNGAANTRPFPIPGAPDSVARIAETSTTAAGKMTTLLVVLRFPSRYVGVLFNASNMAAAERCQPDMATLVSSVKLNAAAPPVQTTPAVISGTSPVGAWEKVVGSTPPMRYNAFTKQWEYNYAAASLQFKQIYRFRFEPNGQYTYELDAVDYNRSQQTLIVERGTYILASGAIQFRPTSYQDGAGPKGKTPPLTTRAVPAPHSRRFTIGEHPVHKESPGLQLQTQEGGWDTFKPAR